MVDIRSIGHRITCCQWLGVVMGSARYQFISPTYDQLTMHSTTAMPAAAQGLLAALAQMLSTGERLKHA
jgi:hypothetical protein